MGLGLKRILGMSEEERAMLGSKAIERSKADAVNFACAATALWLDDSFYSYLFVRVYVKR